MSKPEEQFIRLLSEANELGLGYLIVGGNAINLYGYLRTTYDFDLAIFDEHVATWRALLEKHGYENYFGTPSFLRFKVGSGADLFPVDLMLLDESTYTKLNHRALIKSFGGVSIRIPDPIHLIAMKLHALKNEHRVQQGKDLQDILGLIHSVGMRADNAELQGVLEKYSTSEIRSEILRQLGDQNV